MGVKILANDITNKRLKSNICKQFTQCNIKRNNPIKKWAEDLNRHFFKEEMQMPNRQMQRCSTWLINREMQIKTTVSYHFTPVRMAIIKKNTSCFYTRNLDQRVYVTLPGSQLISLACITIIWAYGLPSQYSFFRPHHQCEEKIQSC